MSTHLSAEVLCSLRNSKFLIFHICEVCLHLSISQITNSAKGYYVNITKLNLNRNLINGLYAITNID